MQPHIDHEPPDRFPTDPSGLPEAGRPELLELVGGDSGRVEREELVSEVLLAPSERAVVDVLADQPGELALEHHTPDRIYRLATIAVAGEAAGPSRAAEFERLRRAPELAVERQQLDRWLPRRRTRCRPWSPRWTTRPTCPRARDRSPIPAPCTPR